MGTWEGASWQWDMEWRRGSIGCERDKEEGLWEVLGSIQIKKGTEDSWQWRYDSKGRYIVKKAYDFLAPMECLLERQVCKLIWCRLVPSKVCFIRWRLCLDKLPARWNLRKRGVVL
ncbi:hypothetical protein SLA2020_291830 [Shorea laevis]